MTSMGNIAFSSFADGAHAIANVVALWRAVRFAFQHCAFVTLARK